MSQRLLIDHATIASLTLAPLEQAFADLGIKTDYGGPHSNGITHMALLGFEDGSYLELISSLEPGRKEKVFWGEHIEGNGGPCAWAARVADVAAEAERVAALGVPVTGPAYFYRRRPDGRLVEWDLAFLGDKGAGAMLPFLIKDRTPREWRVQPSASAVGRLTGIAMVILGVPDLAAAVELFQRVYGWPSPQVSEETVFGAKLGHFTGTPVTLAAPLSAEGWLAARLARFGESPCAYLLRTPDFELASRQFQVELITEWFGRRVGWFDSTKINGVKLGLIE